MSTAVALSPRPTGRCEFVRSDFVGKSGALFWRVIFRPDHEAHKPRKRTGPTDKGTGGTGTT
jgi:hypothetical protein